MSVYKLENTSVILSIESHGAEMKSLINKENGKEYLWCADEKYWSRTSPVLFPLVGNYLNKETYYDGKCYSLSQHGFARDMEFECVSQEDDEIWFAVEDNEMTLEKYPFKFRLSLGYRLEESTVTVLWKVENRDDKTIHFSIGGHPAFNCPMNEGEKQTDYFIGVDAESDLTVGVLNSNGALSDRTKEIAVQDYCFQITEDMFDEDALIIEDEQAQSVSLIDPNGDAYVTVDFDAPLFGIWSPTGKHAPFVCIEPWYGRADRADFNQKLEEREYGNSLEVGEVFEASYTITL